MRRLSGGSLVVLVAVVAALTTGCGAAASPGRPTLDVDSILEATSPFQRDILSDGEVTAPEYESALLAFRTCVEDAGATPSEIREVGNNEKTFDYEVIAPDEHQLQQIDALADACLPDYFADVGRVWAYQQLLTDSEVDRVRPEVAACLRGLGVDVMDDFTLEDLAELVTEDGDATKIQPCVDKFPGFFYVSPESDHADER